MTPLRGRISTSLIPFALAAALVPPSQAVKSQEFPGKPVRMVAGMAAGGGADVNARRLAQMLNRILKQSVVVENKVE